MSPDKFKKLADLIYSADRNCMFSRHARKELAHKISVECSLWEPNVQSFVDEMYGLNFHILEERNIFIQLAEVGL